MLITRHAELVEALKDIGLSSERQIIVLGLIEHVKAACMKSGSSLVLYKAGDQSVRVGHMLGKPAIVVKKNSHIDFKLSRNPARNGAVTPYDSPHYTKDSHCFRWKDERIITTSELCSIALEAYNFWKVNS